MHPVNVPVVAIKHADGQKMKTAVLKGKVLFLAVSAGERTCVEGADKLQGSTVIPKMKQVQPKKQRQQQPQKKMKKPQTQPTGLRRDKHQLSPDEKHEYKRRKAVAMKAKEILIGAATAVARVYPDNFFDDSVGVGR
jgi:hypothetical protein